LEVTGTPTGGTFDVVIGAYTAAECAYDYSDLEAKLTAALPVTWGLEVADEGAGVYSVKFYPPTSVTAAQVVTIDGTDLTGGTDPDVTLVEVAAFAQCAPTPTLPLSSQYQDIGGNLYVMTRALLGATNQFIMPRWFSIS